MHDAAPMYPLIRGSGKQGMNEGDPLDNETVCGDTSKNTGNRDSFAGSDGWP